jgi:uncharacterized protein YbjT (DUF2867 family)
MILITTAGKVGSEAARLLAQRQEPVRVLVRDPDRAATLAQAGVEVAGGDLEVPATIDAAMRGVSAVVLVSPAAPRQELNVIDSAVRAGVGHVVKVTSKASADSPIARRRGQAEIESGLIASGLGYTLLRNNAYMQNFLMLAPAIAKTGSFGSSAGDGRVGMIDARRRRCCRRDRCLTRPARGKDLLAYRARAAFLLRRGGGALESARPADHFPFSYLRRGKAGDDRCRRPRNRRRGQCQCAQPVRPRRRRLCHRRRAVAPRPGGAYVRAVRHRLR